MFRNRVFTLAVLPAAVVLAVSQPLAGSAGQATGPTVGANALVDLDHNCRSRRTSRMSPPSPGIP